MTERVARFGEGGGLIGVLTEPTTGEALPASLGLVVLNVGMLHRVGPFRLGTDLARRVAGLGATSLRFDISGLGDSVAPGAEGTRREQSVADIRRAMDRMCAGHGVERFVLWGLCTGADHAHAAAVADERVCGAVCVEGYAYRTPRFYRHRYAPFLLDPRRLLRYLAWQCRRRVKPTNAPAPSRDALPYVGDEMFGWKLPPKAVLRDELRQLVARPAHLLYVYSGDSMTRSRYNYAGQFKDMFPSLDMEGRVEDLFISEGDHIFAQLPARERLIRDVCAWMVRSFG
jgi:dienelactone hydrolase